MKVDRPNPLKRSGKEAADTSASALRFRDVAEPRMVCLHTGNGSGTKLFQGFLDGHPQVMMVPGYPLMYLYPHWDEWRETFGSALDWPKAVDLICEKHSSILDSRRIPGHDGMTRLGETGDQGLEIDENRFRAVLLGLLDGEDVHIRTFLLAVHYAYAICSGERLEDKKVVVFHIHVHEYVTRYLAPDFPDMLTLGFVRDPRSNLKGRYESSTVAVDAAKLNATDARIYLRRTYYFLNRYMLDGLNATQGTPPEMTRVIRHEDMHYRLGQTVDEAIAFMGLDFDDAQRACTFGGLSWSGDPIYGKQLANKANPRIVSLDWQKWLPAVDWFVLEGILFDYCRRYGYPLYRFKKDTAWDRFLLILAIFVPSVFERRAFKDYLRPSVICAFVRAAVDEGFGRVPLKDYGNNAYYRHKWSNKGLRLWAQPWYARLVHRAQARPDALFRGIAGIVYVGACIVRYVAGLLIHPVWMFRRSCDSLRVLLTRLRGKTVLPATLPAESWQAD